MSHKFETGDRVIDTAADDPDPMRVVHPAVTEAQYAKVNGKPILEYEGNEQYSPTDTVVTVAFESKLGHLMPGWEDHCDDLKNKIEEYRKEWQVEVPRFSYLAPRLELVDEHGNPTESAGSNGTQEEAAN